MSPLPTSICVALSDPLLLLLQVQNRIALGIWYLGVEYFDQNRSDSFLGWHTWCFGWNILWIGIFEFVVLLMRLQVRNHIVIIVTDPLFVIFALGIWYLVFGLESFDNKLGVLAPKLCQQRQENCS